jgi:hypothetical protein
MRPEDFRDSLRKQPFQPFRVTLTDGRTYEVHHPELAMVGRSVVILGLAGPHEPEPVFDRHVTVSLLHIMQIEPIVPASEGSARAS